MSRIARSTVDEIHRRLDAISVVEGYIRLEKRGGRYWGRCPFHGGGQERTPSLTVDPDKKLYHCFGCGKGGSILDFVMEMDKTDYPETLRNLARKMGVQVVNEEGGSADNSKWEAELSKREKLAELYGRTAGSFSHFLLERPEGRAALEYLLARGISRETVAAFRLGFSPESRDWLYRFLSGKGYSQEFLDGSGLFSTNHRGSAFFSGRLMFPVADRQGRTVAFAGRVLPGTRGFDGREPPKYINSRENEIYRKGQLLYALDLALPAIRKDKTVHVAEGYMDVIALHQAGIASAVGICGTTFTDEQATLLRHWAETAVLVLDSDEAGQKAAERAVVTCRKNGLACRLVVSGKDETGEALKDPAEILQKHGGETLKKAMQNTIIDFEYLIARGKKLYDTSIPQGKARAFAMLFPYLDALASEAEKDDCIGAAADLLRIGVEAAKADFRRAGKGKAVAGGTGTGNRIRMNEELFLLTLVAANGELYPEFRAEVALAEIADEAAKELFLVMEECFRNGEAGMDALLAGIGGDALRGFLVARLASDEFKGGAEGFPDCRKMMEDGIKRIRARKLRSRVSEIAGTLRFMERNPEDSGGGNFDDLIAEKMRLDTEIRILEGKQ